MRADIQVSQNLPGPPTASIYHRYVSKIVRQKNQPFPKQPLTCYIQYRRISTSQIDPPYLLVKLGPCLKNQKTQTCC